jgi:predicted NAD/FAD-binding protein
VAVLGAGISGLTAAYLLARTHTVILFEANKRLGGHAHTHDVVDSDGQQLAVDSAFIVHNDLTYPWLRKLFGELDVEVRPTEMSMSVRCEGCGLEYAGGRGIRGVFSQRRRLVDPRFMHMLWQVRRFHRRASAFLGDADEANVLTYGQFLRQEGFSDFFVAHYCRSGSLVRLVGWTRYGVDVPGPLSVPVPRASRHAADHRFTAVVQRRWRIPQLRRPSCRAARRRSRGSARWRGVS